MGCKWQVSHGQSHLGPSARGRGASPWEAPEFAVRARGSAVLGAVLQVTRWLPQNCDRISSGRKGGWPSDPWGGGGRGRGAAGELGPRATGPPSRRTAPAGPAWSRAQLGELARPHRGPVPLPRPACSVTHRPLPRPALAGAGVDFLPGELPACIIHEAPAHTGGILMKATEGTARLLPHAPARGDGPPTAATGPLGKEGGGERGLDGQRRPEADPLPPPAVIPALERARGAWDCGPVGVGQERGHVPRSQHQPGPACGARAQSLGSCPSSARSRPDEEPGRSVPRFPRRRGVGRGGGSVRPPPRSRPSTETAPSLPPPSPRPRHRRLAAPPGLGGGRNATTATPRPPEPGRPAGGRARGLR